MTPSKERILHAALDLFSTKGFSGVSVQEIAEKVGIKAPSLYKHFRSKQAIFEAILDQENERYHEETSQFRLNSFSAEAITLDGDHPEMDSSFYAAITEDQLVDIGKRLFLYFLHDELAAKIRRILTMEQFNNPELADRYVKRYIDDPLRYQAELFARLSPGEPESINEIKALHFYAPMYLLLLQCDADSEREQAALAKVETHIRQFSRLYS